MTDSVQTDCIATACERPTFEVGYCRYHYSSLMKSGELPKRRIKNDKCEAPNCDLPARRLRLCLKHVAQFAKRGHEPDFQFDIRAIRLKALPKVCTFGNCQMPRHTSGFCRTHYVQSRRVGRPMVELNRGAKCPVTTCDQPGGLRRKLCKSHAYYARQYGLSGAQISELFETERECGNSGCKSKVSLHLDHDHSCCPGSIACGRCVRGWLCKSCNVALGLLKEDPDRATGLAEYVRSF